MGPAMTDAKELRGMKLIAGNSNRALSDAIGQVMKLPRKSALQ